MKTLNSRVAGSNIWLWASAVVLVALIMVQLGRSNWRGAPSSAHDAAIAGMMAGDIVSRAGDYSIMCFEAGSEDIVVVMDGHTEDLYAYRVRNQKTLEFLLREKLPDIFQHVKTMESTR